MHPQNNYDFGLWKMGILGDFIAIFGGIFEVSFDIILVSF
jgi:hypothetical protein